MRKGIENQPMINGKAYSFAHIVLIIAGVRIYGVRSIDYATNQEKANEHGAGREPIERGYGPKNYQGSIELTEKGAQRLRQVAPNKDLTDLPEFSVTVHVNNGETAFTDRLQRVEFNEHGVSGSVGDTTLTRSNPIIIGKIRFGGAPVQ